MAKAGTDAARLRDVLRRVIRSSGALEPDRTACGLPLPPSHAHALMWLASASDAAAAPMSQRDLASALALDKSSVARLCQRMVEAGHLEMARDESNGRFVRLRLTPKGVRAAARVERASLERHARLVSAIPARERRAVLAALERLAHAMSLVPPGGGP